ncbi:MAG: PepSY-like domain-containing protein [Bacteroidales bacterium]|nr:PepSY-like domain-containing protein [Bacteroidales bacterium]
MKFLTFIITFVISLSLFSQKTLDSEVPEIVQKNFNRKYPRAENVSWDKVDNNYKVDCFYKDLSTYAEFTPEGEWVQTISEVDYGELYPPIERYLDENFPKDKVIIVEKATLANRQDYYYVQLERKQKGKKEPLVFELFFDKTGQIEQVKAPEGFEDLTVVGIDDHNAETPAAVIDSWQKRFPRAEGIEWTSVTNPSDSIDYNYIASFVYRYSYTMAEFLPNGKWIETRVAYDVKDLYAPILKYLVENHKNDKFVLAEKVTRADRKDYYYVNLERFEKGQTRPYKFELFFNKSGKIQKVIRPEELKSQYLLTVDIPKNVGKKFNSRFASAKDVKWGTKEGNWEARFIYRERPTTAEFSDSAQWIMTVVELDVKNIYAPVQRTIDNEYPDYRVIYGEKATRKDRKDYYYMELINKKKKTDNQKLGLYFDKTGRLKDQ